MTAEQRKRALRRHSARRRRRRQITEHRILFTVAAVAIIAAIAGLITITSAGETKKNKLTTVEAAGTQETAATAETEATEAETEAAGETLIKSLDWDFEDSYRLAKIAMAEAESEDTEGKALVILTVLNRVWSPQFPDTIEGVITQAGAFASYSDGRYGRVEPDKDCWAALYLVQMERWDESNGALYFEVTPDPGESTWHSRNLQALFTHGRHTFYREVATDEDGA